ncbi:PEBP-like protein, partial [Meira miltonrushii]
SSLALAIAASTSMTFAQSTPQDQINEGIANVMLQLEGAHVVPNLISADQLQLRGLLNQQFGGSNVTTGELVGAVDDVKNMPIWTIEYSSQASASGQFLNASYTVMTLDPGAPSEQPRNIVRHFLANNITLDTATGGLRNTSKPIAGWFSPAPPAGSGVHRYTTLVFRQPANFTSTLPAYLQNRNETIDTNFDLAQYIKEADLGPIVAANFFLLQNSDTSASMTASGVVSTSAVPSASVSAAVSSISSSLSSVYAASSTGESGKSGAVGSPLLFSQSGIALMATAFFV